jgi:hypothetical protein
MVNVCTRFCLRRRWVSTVGNKKQKDSNVLDFNLLLPSENMGTQDHME